MLRILKTIGSIEPQYQPFFDRFAWTHSVTYFVCEHEYSPALDLSIFFRRCPGCSSFIRMNANQIYSLFKHFLILCLFASFGRYLLSPFGKSLGIKSTRTKRAPANAVLEAAYNQCSRLHHKTVSKPLFFSSHSWLPSSSWVVTNRRSNGYVPLCEFFFNQRAKKSTWQSGRVLETILITMVFIHIPIIPIRIPQTL